MWFSKVIAAILLFNVVSFAAVARNDNGNGTTNVLGMSATSSPMNLTTFSVSAGSNQCLIAYAQVGDQTSTLTMTWDQGGTNQTMTQTAAFNPPGFNDVGGIFKLINPTTGTKTLQLTWSGAATTASIVAINFSGADQSTCTKSTDDVYTLTGTSGMPTITVTSTSTGATVACVNGSVSGGSVTTTNFTSVGTVRDVGCSFHLGGTSNAHTFTDGGATDINTGVHILAAAGGGGTPKKFLGGGFF